MSDTITSASGATSNSTGTQPTTESAASSTPAQQNVQQDNQQNVQQVQSTQQTDSTANQVDDFTSAYDVEGKEEQQIAEPVIPDDYNLTNYNGEALQGESYQSVKELFKGAKLTQEQASAMYDAYNKSITDAIESNNKAIQKMKSDWVAQVKSDNELGGQNFETTKLNIGRVMEKYGNAELRDFLNKSGLGLNPAFVRFINKVGGAIGNDTNFVNGKGGAPTQQQLEEEFGRKMYPNSPELWSGKR